MISSHMPDQPAAGITDEVSERIYSIDTQIDELFERIDSYQNITPAITKLEAQVKSLIESATEQLAESDV